MDHDALFAEAVKATVHRWTALNLAVHNDWGNGNCSEKRDNMVSEICNGFAVGLPPFSGFRGAGRGKSAMHRSHQRGLGRWCEEVFRIGVPVHCLESCFAKCETLLSWD